jgi:predicted DNA-binding protein (MmcQ/YjbR family)
MQVQMYSLIHLLKNNYEINMHSQPINSAILKNLCQVKRETHMNKKRLDIYLVQLLWLDLDQERLIKCYL